MQVGVIRVNNIGLEFLVVDKNNKRSNKKHTYYNIKFIKSGYVDCVRSDSIKNGLVKDNLSKSLYGVASIGYINTRKHFHEYRIWEDMISRCYNKLDKCYKYYGQCGVIVCKQWLRFDNFYHDIPTIMNYNKQLFKDHKQQLDKDIRSKGDFKQYAPNTTMWVSILKNQQRKTIEYNKKHPKYAVFPDGHVEQILHVTNFCKKHNLHRQNVNLCLAGKQTSTKGFKFYRE